ncbi:sugar 3,4-ketoisomerase [Paralcaligenes ginsengisoli]
MSLIRLLNLPSIGDGRGNLFVVEANKNLPFEIKRVYYMSGMSPGTERGFHAHKDLQQLAICVAGRCCITLDDGENRQSVWLDSPAKGLLIGSLIWREMSQFSDDCVLLVFASQYYDEADYIRDYTQFCAASKHV